VLLTTSLARRLGNDRTALLAGIVLLSMWRPWSLDRPLVDLDGAALVIASLYFYVEADRPISRLGDWAYLLSAAAAGAAAHEAGIAGALLPLLGIVVFHAGERTLRRLLRPTVVASLLFAAAFPTLLRATLGERGVTGADPPSFRTCSRWILVGVLPVAIVLPFVLFDHFKVRGFREDHGFADRAWRFPKAALVAALVLLVAAPTSREIGGLAVLPMLALLVASWFDRLWRRRA
jgi:hypothetical protein